MPWSLTHSLARSLNHPPIYSLPHSLAHSLAYRLRSHTLAFHASPHPRYTVLTYSKTPGTGSRKHHPPPVRSTTHSLTHLLTHLHLNFVRGPFKIPASTALTRQRITPGTGSRTTSTPPHASGCKAPSQTCRRSAKPSTVRPARCTTRKCSVIYGRTSKETAPV